jgi:DNA replication and repair protein RecF
MFFSGTYFHNFRNLRGERREWPPGFNLITGPNGAGKTNFLEGLNLISGWGPFDRNLKVSGLVRRGISEDGRSSSASLWGRIRGEEDSEIFASIQSRCQLKRDDRAIGAVGMRSHIPVLSFMPDDMSLLGGGASRRRRLLDMVGALVSVSYAKIVHDYRYILRQKSALLRKQRDVRAADRLMAPLGAWIWSAREEILRMIESELENFSDLLPSPMEIFFERGGGAESGTLDDFKKSLQRFRDREKFSRVPLVGPQRDDVKFFCGGIETNASLSRGQSRRAVSALILASAMAVERRLGKKPVLIFDELTSELDEAGRIFAVEALINTGCQVFAATADSSAPDGVKVHRMKDGRFL